MHSGEEGLLKEVSRAFHRAVHTTLVTIIRCTQTKPGSQPAEPNQGLCVRMEGSEPEARLECKN